MTRELIWENLQQNRCPYCDADLKKPDAQSIIRCTRCLFKIELLRYESIRDCRRQAKKGVKFFWQNVLLDKCPLCSNDLIDTTGRLEILKCVGASCDFHIRQDRLAQIIADPTHPANKCKGLPITPKP